MAGTKQGGVKNKAKLLALDPDYFRKLGSRGGKVGGSKGFALMDKDRLRQLGHIGGSKSRRIWTDEAKRHHSEVMVAKLRSKREVI